MFIVPVYEMICHELQLSDSWVLSILMYSLCQLSSAFYVGFEFNIDIGEDATAASGDELPMDFFADEELDSR